jgi:hypothetical protein
VSPQTQQTEVDQDVGYYVYAIVPADLPVPPLRGLDDVEVETIARDDIAAVVTRFALERPAGRKAELVAHSRVVDALAETGPVAPVRFGSVLEHDPEAVHELLDEQAEVARETLQHVSGKVQLNLRVSYVEEQVLAEVVREQPRIAELRERTRGLPEGAVHRDLVELGELVSAAVEAKSAADAELVVEAVQRHEVELVERPGGGVDHVVDLALLVPEDRLEAVEQMLEEQAEATHGRLRWRLVGPVAPYDFAGGVSWD